MNKSFGYYVTRYFGEYLPKQKGVSDNTIKSYRDTFVQMIEFFSLTYSININKLSLSDMSKERIEKFLKYLEETRHVCASTRNQRLAAVHAFFRYLQKQELAYFELCNSILLIEFKKVSAPVINYMSIEETSFLFLLPDNKTSHGFRDLAILTLLYETGARVQELLDLRLKNISLNQCSTVTLHGKGNKTRIVPIGKDMVSILRKYISATGINNPEDSLFTNKQHKALTRAGVQYIIDKYVDKGRGIRSDYFKGKITNHSFRHYGECFKMVSE